jgi:stage III sporulation protein SpoIIIAA
MSGGTTAFIRRSAWACAFDTWLRTALECVARQGRVRIFLKCAYILSFCSARFLPATLPRIYHRQSIAYFCIQPVPSHQFGYEMEVAQTQPKHELLAAGGRIKCPEVKCRAVAVGLKPIAVPSSEES